MNELSHHGVKGQKWGIQNGPPYPLSEKQQRHNYRAIKKAANTSLYEINKKGRLKTALGQVEDSSRNLVDVKKLGSEYLKEYKKDYRNTHNIFATRKRWMTSGKFNKIVSDVLGKYANKNVEKDITAGKYLVNKILNEIEYESFHEEDGTLTAAGKRNYGV